MIALRDTLRKFVAERDWDKFHSPKNLAMALSVEASELMEHFQWLTEEQSRRLTPEKLAEVRDEMADVLVYLVRLADKLDVDLLDAAAKKIEKNTLKYPADKVRGSMKKYSDY
ncbi:MAG TPA: nucleotide pyrophosphohydrolase [Burkholderiales bacterium]|nr:nucleotide pyrophosphohydrolase [Burkholderiales bacterium]